MESREVKSQLTVEYLRSKIVEQLDMSRDIEDSQLYAHIDSMLVKETEGRYMTVKTRMNMRKALYDSFRRLDVISEALDDPEVTEIMVNGPDHIFIEKHGEIIPFHKNFSSAEKLEDVIQQIVARVNRRVNEASPLADARLEDGSRVHIALPPASIDGPVLTIRKFCEKTPGMKELVAWGALSRETADFLGKLVKSGYNIFISGGTGAGKTTFLGALAEYISADERVVTIEDSAELRLYHVRNLVRLEARTANQEGDYEITIRELIRNSLRMRPSRIIIGEIRGAEAMDMLQALNTGHSGSMSTGHSNSAEDMLSRIETMCLMGTQIPLAAIRGQIASAIDIIVHLGRLRDRSRKVMSIHEVLGTDETGKIITAPLYRFCEKGMVNGKIVGELQKERELENTDKLAAAGLLSSVGSS